MRFLAGGTTLVDLMKLGVEHPERVVDINRLGLDDIQRQPDGDLSDRRDRSQQRSGASSAGARALRRAVAGHAGRRLGAVAQRRDHRRQPVAAHALHVFPRPGEPCNKREPGSGCAAIGGANRTLAILGTSEACIATNPSDMAVAMLAYDAVVHVEGVSGQRQIPLDDFYRAAGRHGRISKPCSNPAI